jgi:hypothetical protein
LRGQCGPLSPQRILLATLLAAQFRTVPLDGALRGAQRIQSLALGGNRKLGVAQARAQCVALFKLIAKMVRKLGDTRAHRSELGFSLSRVLGFRRRAARAGAKQGG